MTRCASHRSVAGAWEESERHEAERAGSLPLVIAGNYG